jgi:hypothetical protein
MFNQRTHSHVSDIKINLEALECHVLRLFSPFFRSLFLRFPLSLHFGSDRSSSEGKKKMKNYPHGRLATDV